MRYTTGRIGAENCCAARFAEHFVGPVFQGGLVGAWRHGFRAILQQAAPLHSRGARVVRVHMSPIACAGALTVPS